MLILVTINYFRVFRQTDDLEMRQRASFFILSSLVLAITLTITSFIEYIDYRIRLEPIIFALSIYGAIITIGILKVKLFDIDVIVSKSVKYTLLNVGLAWIFD